MLKMDIIIAAQVAGMLKTAIDAVQGLTKKLPEGEGKKEAEVTLAKAEQQLKLAEAQIASDLKYELCRNHFPPEIMLLKNNKDWTCPEPECDNTRYTGPAIATVEVDPEVYIGKRRTKIFQSD
jgi:hypothetical protein